MLHVYWYPYLASSGSYSQAQYAMRACLTKEDMQFACYGCWLQCKLLEASYSCMLVCGPHSHAGMLKQ